MKRAVAFGLVGLIVLLILFHERPVEFKNEMASSQSLGEATHPSPELGGGKNTSKVPANQPLGLTVASAPKGQANALAIPFQNRSQVSASDLVLPELRKFHLDQKKEAFILKST
jgi:hypothetical protein